ncbi:MAG: helix-turn-helix transcriptional regulator [Lachnospiraceae bacterium]|nr:helix-turn-helix transcriptional regulator [Lachnospiraceae bacterium]
MEKVEKKAKEGIQLTIIEKIEALMEDNKINQATLARETGIAPAQLSKCLNRKGNNYVGIDTLLRISDYFKVPVDHLLGRSTIRLPEKSLSNADICRHLVNLIETNTVNIINAAVEEDTYQPGKGNAEDQTDQYRYEKKKNPYKMFFFSNFRPLPDMKGMNKGEKKKIETELNANGLYYPKRVEINAFIEYYLKLRDLYKKNDLPRAFFEQAIEDRLNQMRY